MLCQQPIDETADMLQSPTRLRKQRTRTSQGCTAAMAAHTASHSRLVSVKMMHLPLPLYTVIRSFRTLTRDSGDTWHASSLHERVRRSGQSQLAAGVSTRQLIVGLLPRSPMMTPLGHRSKSIRHNMFHTRCNLRYVETATSFAMAP